MITKYYQSNILRDKSQLIVIPVNIMGIPGAGLAKQWADRFPECATIYRSACRSRQLSIGKVLFIKDRDCNFICLPTKTLPQYPSELKYIEKGLVALRQFIHTKEIKSLAIPALGCGLGRLSWQEVVPLIEQYLDDLEIPVHIYLPKSFPRRFS
jgi:O-acetyl-ADP-ribose deacetylase (regulator of RNase III)